MYYIKNTDVPHLAARLSRIGDVYIPSEKTSGFGLIRYVPPTDEQEIILPFNSFRTEFPYLKTLLFKPKCTVAQYPGNADEGIPPKTNTYVFGIKACDLRARKILDAVFLEGDYIDPFYKVMREGMVLISGDCTAAKDSCFCTMVDGQPYPTEGYDLNLSPVSDGFVIETGSPKGDAIISGNEEFFMQADGTQIQERDARRNELSAVIQKNNESVITSADTRKQSIERNLNAHTVWDRTSQTCVACNACNYVCPTCYCFLLYDRKTNGGSERIRVWDSCFHAGYARMAGGLTPRLRLVDRFKNHYYHKFDSYVENFGFEACSGCGRCINACSGNIDKRKVLKEIERYVELQ